jgi:hypothetical protein
MLAAGMQPGPAQLDFVAISGRRFSRVRVAQGPMVEGSGAVIAAGTHSDPANAVSVWNASVAGDPRHADRLLDHEEEIHDNYDGGPCARPALSYRVDGDVAALEFWGAGHVREDGSLRLWAGTSAGSVSLLSAQRYEHETDAEGRRLEAWQVRLVCPCQPFVACASSGCTCDLTAPPPPPPKRAGVPGGYGRAHRQGAAPLAGRLCPCRLALWRRRAVSGGGRQGLVARVHRACGRANAGGSRGLCCDL